MTIRNTVHLPKHARCVYHARDPSCSYSLAMCFFSQRRGFILAVSVSSDQALFLFLFAWAPSTCFAVDEATGPASSRAPCQNGSDLETGSFPCPARDAARLPS